MASTFNPNAPTGLVKLNVDYQSLQNNNQQLDTSFGFDHYQFSDQTANNGFHKKVTLIQQSGATSSAAQMILFTKSSSGSSELHMVRDGFPTTEVCLTTPVFTVPIANTTGYTFLAGPAGGATPGAMILQWGIVNGTHGSDNHFNNGDNNTVNFATSNVNFPNNCWALWFTPQYNTNTGSAPSSEATITYDIKTISKSKFDWTFLTNSSEYTRFTWIALGN